MCIRRVNKAFRTFKFNAFVIYKTELINFLPEHEPTFLHCFRSKKKVYVILPWSSLTRFDGWNVPQNSLRLR